MKRLSIVALVGLVAGALSTTGVATAQAVPEPLASENISLVTVLEGTTGAIGANFRDDVMYLTTTTGLQTFDISTPEAPVRLGVLPLPHFENEDVSIGGDILLISNDASESTGLLHVINIKNPKSPTLLTSFPMGGSAAGGPGHTASCILECKYAWVTDGAGIKVVDLTEPAAPVMLDTIATGAGGEIATHDVQVDANGLAWVVGFGGAVAYKIPKNYDGTDLGVEVARTNEEGFSTYGDQFGLGSGDEPNDYILHNSRRLWNGKVVYVTEEDYTRPGCEGAGQFETWTLPTEKVIRHGKVRRIPTGADLTPLGSWVTESLANPEAWQAWVEEQEGHPDGLAALCSAHYFDIKRRVVAQGWYEQGLRLLDVSDPADIRQIGYFVDPTAVVWASYFAPTDPKGRIIYNFDYKAGVQVLEFDRPAKGTTGVIPCKGPSKKKCEKNHKPVKVKAEVRDEWIGSYPLEFPVPIEGTPDQTWGYACRLIWPELPGLPLATEPASPAARAPTPATKQDGSMGPGR